MRLLALAGLLLLSACSVRQQCAASCSGCCDLEGTCWPGTEPWACGGKIDCQSCLVGQGCDGGCVGASSDSTLQFAGTNGFVPKGAQGFTYSDSSDGFILLSDVDRSVCRDPHAILKSEEDVVLISMAHLSAVQFERITFVDGGVRRVTLVGSENLSLRGTRLVGNVSLSSPEAQLAGTVDVVVCGQY